MRTALLTATALVALSSLTVAQNQLAATAEVAPKAKLINPDAGVDPTMPRYRLTIGTPAAAADCTG